MAKHGKKDPLVRAKGKVAKAQNRYMKTVAKGERQIRGVRAEVDESIARAKAEFEMRANQLAEIEQEIARKSEDAVSAEEAANRVTAAQQHRPSKKASAATVATPEEAASRVAKVQQRRPVKKAPTGSGVTPEEAASRVARAQQKPPVKKAPAQVPAAAAKVVRAASAAAARPKPEAVAANGDGSKSGAEILTKNGTQGPRKSTKSTQAPRTRRTGQGNTGDK